MKKQVETIQVHSHPLVKTTPHRFHGGIHPEEHKTESSLQPIVDAPIPAKLIIPLQQNFGVTPTAMVQSGDKVLKGQLIGKANGNISANVHASSSGVVTSVEKRVIAHASGLEEWCVIIETDGEDRPFVKAAAKTQEEKSPFENESLHPNTNKPASESCELIESAFIQHDRQALLNKVHQCGIVGLGGASFPSHIKLMSRVDTLIINAAECEPYITCDDRLLQEQPNELLKSFRCLMRLVGATKCIVGIEDNKPTAINALAEHLKPNDSIELCVLPTKYPSGGERQLIELITGQQVPRGQLPSSLGVLVHNVATAYAIYQAVVFDQPLISRVVTLTGSACQKPGNYRVRIGTPIQELIQLCSSENAHKILMGGPMMGFEINSDASVVKSSNCFLFAKKNELKERHQPLPCIRCGECAEVCPAQLLPQQLYWFSKAEEFEKAEDYHLMDCIECGACAYVCPSEIPLVQYYRFSKSEIKQRKEEKRKAQIAKERNDFRALRLERDKAERAEKHKKAAEARRKAAEDKGQADEKKSTIAEAVARAKAKKEQQEQSSK